MPQMDVVPFNNPGNAILLDEIRGELTPDYQRRIPAATQAGLDATMNALWQYQPALNQVVDALVNLIGAQIIKNITWTNPLARYKRGLLNRGETIEEVYVGLIKAKSYNVNAEYLEKELFGREANNVHSAFHKINRAEYYKLTIPEAMLERAFLNQNGIGNLLNDLMESIGTSDQWDEYLEMTSTLNRYHERNGFHTVRVPDISSVSSDATDAKQFLRTVRSLSDTLPFVSTKYNARHIERATRKQDLQLITTPEGQASLDVEALAAAFNVGSMDIAARTTVLPAEHIGIPGFQGLLTTSDFFIFADNIMRMGQTQNPVGMYSNYFWHHQETISASPFENAILLSSIEEDTITLINYLVTGIRPFTITDIIDDTNTVTVTNDAATVERGGAYVVATASTMVSEGGNAGPDGAVVVSLTGNQSLKTRINQQGVLIVGYDEPAGTITVHVEAVGDSTFDRDLTLTIVGAKVYGSVGLAVDDNPGVIANTRLPGITPQGGPVGTTFTTNNGSWDTTDLTFAIQWQRDGVDIAGATGVTYESVTADGGHSIASVITASKTGLTGASATSKSVPVTAS